MLGRRARQTRLQRLREALWPSMGLYRLGLYYRNRMGRLRESPYAIAAGFASGVAISFTPFIGFHLALGGAMTLVLRGSLVAMVVGTVVVGNFWTFPAIWVATYKLGRLMLGKTAYAQRLADGFSFMDMLHHPVERLLPMALGSVPFFIVSWIVAFYAARHIAAGYKEARQERLSRKKKG